MEEGDKEYTTIQLTGNTSQSCTAGVGRPSLFFHPNQRPKTNIVSLGNQCIKRGAILHELMHVIGKN